MDSPYSSPMKIIHRKQERKLYRDNIILAIITDNIFSYFIEIANWIWKLFISQKKYILKYIIFLYDLKGFRIQNYIYSYIYSNYIYSKAYYISLRLKVFPNSTL